MFSIEASDAERLVKITWSDKVDSDEMRRCAEEIGVRISKMRPGFRVLADMTDLESMDSAGAPYIGSIMDLCVTKQVEHVVRVIPDPHKDIGLNIMSYFHYGSKVRVTICENLADAMRRLAEKPMETNILGNSDLSITPVGFGAWAIGGDWEFGWGAQDDAQSVAAIHRALELGVNWIDTAAVYGLGHSEEVVARALQRWQGPRPYVFTKCGMIWNTQGKVDYSLRQESIRRECEASLRRLKTDVIDLYQIHWTADDLNETLEGWTTLVALQKEGKVRWIGLSNASVEEMEKLHGIGRITSLQPPYSLVRRDVETAQLPWCRRENVGVIVYSPMASGLLTGAMSRERIAALAKTDWRTRNEQFKEPRLSENFELVERLRAVGTRHGRTPGEIAIAWTLRHPAVTGAIVGARNSKQVDGIIGAMDFRLTASEIAEVEGQ